MIKMIQVRDYRGESIELAIELTNYTEGNFIAIKANVCDEGGDEECYTVLSRNVPEAGYAVEDHLTLIPVGNNSVNDQITQALIKSGLLIPMGAQFPYNFYTLELFKVCLEKADRLNFWKKGELKYVV